MAASTHSFIDIAALDAVRRHFAAGDGVIVLTTDLTQVIWANGPGAAILGFPGIEAAIGAESGLSRSARRQIEATPGYPDIGSDRPITVRMAAGLISQVAMFRASRLLLPGDEAAIMLVVPFGGSASRSEEEIAERAISGFDEPGHYLALLDAGGRPRAATPGFDRLGMEAADLSRLASDMTGQRDRLLKRIVRVAGHAMPVGVARLCDDPTLYLLITVDERQMAAEPLEAPAVVVDDSQIAVATFSETADERPGEAGERPADAADQPKSAALSDDENATPAEVEDASDAAVMQEAPEEASSAATPEERVEAEPPHEEPDIRAPAAPGIDRSAAHVRFVWRTDAEGRFTSVSPEFVAAVGAPAADIVGKSFSEVARRLALDPDGEIAALLERRDTWSGRSVLWPVAGTELMAPVDLAALPAYDRERRFEGFRGFGVVRIADAVADPRRTGLALNEADAGPADSVEAAPPVPAEEASEKSDDPFRGEVPALDVASRPRERRYTDKVIRLAEHRPPASDKGLSPLERIAFREIGEHLKRTSSGARAADGPEDVTGEKTAETTADEGAAEVEQIAAGDEREDTTEEGSAADEPAAEREAPETEQPEDDGVGVSKEIVASAPQEDAAAGDGAVAADTGREPVEDEARPYTSRSLFDFVDRAAEPAAAAAPPLKQTGFLPSAFAERRADTSILAQLPIPVLIHSGDTLHYANEAFFQLTGYGSIEELAALGGLDALLSGPAEDRREGDNRVLLRSRDRAEFPVSAFLQSVPWLGGKALLLTLTRQPAPAVADTAFREKELEARLAELRTILDTATDGVVLIDNDGIVRSISRPAEALFGYEGEQIVGKPFTALFAIESQRSAQDYLSGLSGTGVASVLNDGREVIGREAQGRFIPLFMTIGRLPGEGGYCAVLRDITQWKRAEEDLTQARAQAERTSSQKSDFLARVSHEIRTPLNAIIGFSELMLDEKFGPIANDRYRDYLRDINRSGNHVLDLVNDLLDISKIEAGQQEMEYEAISLNDALTETVAMMQPQANRERVIIRSSLASKLPEVVADLRSVRQIALNILSNAVRYTQAGGQVIVSTAYEPNGEVVMRVRDTGIGMTPSEIEQALKPFKQVNALKRARGDGTGLGLPLTKAMVEANRAKFAIYSTPGEGTLVEVTFPSTRVLAG